MDSGLLAFCPVFWAVLGDRAACCCSLCSISCRRDTDTDQTQTLSLRHPPTSEAATHSDLLLLQGLDKGVFQTVCVFCLQSLLLVGGHALLAEDPSALLLLPVGGEVGPALGAVEGLHAGQRPPQLP